MRIKDRNIRRRDLVGQVGGRYVVRLESYSRRVEGEVLWFIFLTVVLLFCIMGLLTGCAHGAYGIGRPEAWRIEAQQGVTYRVSYEFDASIETQRALIKGIEYWNELAGKRIFKPAMGSELEDWQIIVGPDRPSEGCNGAAIGCAVWPKRLVWISPLETGNAEYFETIVRHELGHLLGLDHTPGWSCNIVSELMCSAVAPPDTGEVKIHPLDASKEDVQILRRIHPDIAWKDMVFRWEL
jgi:hypothetical protein